MQVRVGEVGDDVPRGGVLAELLTVSSLGPGRAAGSPSDVSARAGSAR